MKKRILIIALGLGALAAFAGTCTVRNVSLTKIGANDVFAGEIRNDTGANFLQHNIVVAFVDSSGSVVDTKTVTPCLRTLQNGQSDFFSARSTQAASVTSVAIARLAVDSSLKVGTAETGDLTFSNLTFARQDGTTLKVAGSVKNVDSTELTEPTVCIVVKDSSGKIIVVAKDETLNDLSTNESDTFAVSVSVPDSTTLVSSVDVYVDGLKDGTPIEAISDTGNNVTLCTPTATRTSTATATNTPGAGTPTATDTNTPTATATATATTTPVTATNTPANTNTPTATRTPVC